MTTSSNSIRQTKYCTAIEQLLPRLGHATNAQLLDILRADFPALTATTVHRATARLAERGVIGTAPAALDGSMRYDADTVPHDHFMCSRCGMLRDARVKALVQPILEQHIAGCSVAGPLTIGGICSKCRDKKEY